MKKKLAAALLAALLLCAMLLTACGAPEFVFSKENILNHLDVSKLTGDLADLRLQSDVSVQEHDQCNRQDSDGNVEIGHPSPHTVFT